MFAVQIDESREFKQTVTRRRNCFEPALCTNALDLTLVPICFQIHFRFQSFRQTLNLKVSVLGGPEVINVWK